MYAAVTYEIKPDKPIPKSSGTEFRGFELQNSLVKIFTRLNIFWKKPSGTNSIMIPA